MCSIPPLPPPLPIFHEVKIPKYSKENIELTDNTFCLWAVDYPELQQACIKNNICKFTAPHNYSYNRINSIIQEGPTCGMVALAMLINKVEVNIKEIYEIAKAEAFTTYGEMFSCKSMLKLAKKMFDKYNVRGTEIILRKGDLCGSYIVQKLLDKCLILVPYDADYNHYPTLKGGHKAHWAVICGIIVPKEGHTPQDCYVICRQGKSRHLGIWSLSDLEKSNKNLYEYSKNKDVELPFVFPEGGMEGENGLLGQYILIEGLN